MDRTARITRRLSEQRPRANPSRRSRPSPTAPEHPVVNPLEVPGLSSLNRSRSGRRFGGDEQLFLMQASTGGISSAHFAYVWARSFEDAFEKFVEYLDENFPGMLVTVGLTELREAAEDLGYEWKSTWPDWDDRRFEKVAERAEADLTPIGHTSLESGTHIPSENWHGQEVSDPEEFERVWAYSLHKFRREYGDEP